ncbi:ATP-binding protein [Aureispira sp. CCB-E]|uniref:ATP-binding protein n=1 Tax=Aureispira sp. CCB-E TaxID=3051121 RepID=UPI0028690563|nr:ATP-binding protein [Aureispira sp. CCB-E]WMX17170.1 ATP-binding protein [Aureispira sp. CCB-E]
MKNLRRIGLYGVKGVGKTTILKEVNKLTSNAVWLEGAKLVLDAAKLPLTEFKKLPKDKKHLFREQAIEKAIEVQSKMNKHILIDGHLVFPKGEDEFENVMTDKDNLFYTDFVYLVFPPKVILQRQKDDLIKKRIYSLKTIKNWIEFEMSELEKVCELYKINLHILSAKSNSDCINFILNLINPNNNAE